LNADLTYEECTGHQDENAFITNGLRIDSIGAVLYLLKGQVLRELVRALFFLQRLSLPEAFLQ
jgi:hypothetical protein